MQQLGLSTSTPKSSNRLKELLWPGMKNAVAARTAASNGQWACFLIAGVTVFLVMGRVHHFLFLIDAVIFAYLGICIRRLSRIAALAAFAWYTLGRMFWHFSNGCTFSIVIPVIIFFLLLNSIRATFAYHRLQKRPPETAASSG